MIEESKTMLDFWLEDKRLGKAERSVLAFVASIYPEERSGPDVATEVGYQYSGGFQSSLSKLRTLGLIYGPNAGFKASSMFFGEGGM